MYKGPIVVADNAYGNPIEEGQCGPRVRRGTKSPNRVTKPYPRGVPRYAGKRK